MSNQNKIFLLMAILVVTIFFGICLGSVLIPLRGLFALENRAVLSLRIMRVIFAVLAGAGLSVCGVVLQAILRNPLADPYLLGTSSGAGFGAVIAIILGVSSYYIPFAAFIVALLSVVLVYNLFSNI